MQNAILLVLGELLRKEFSAGELLKRIVDVLVDELGSDRGTIFLLDAKGQELVSIAAHLPELKEIRVPIAQGVAGYVARTGNVVNIPYCETDSRFWRKIDKQTGYTTRSMLSGPLRDKEGRLLGVAQVLNKKVGGYFDKDDERIFLELCSQIGSLLEDSTLHSNTGSFKGSIFSDSEAEESSELPLGEQINRVIGRGLKMQQVFRNVQRVALTEASVLLRGESGTGKSLIAKAIHYNSLRSHGAWVHLDCTTLPEGLMENELFGHEKGSYTGADQTKLGKVELASGGTLFLDEVGDLPLSLQSKLLTLLQERTFSRIGGSESLQADIRVIAATNRSLEELVEKGLFREDLYYRLRVVQIEIPPLRERGREDLLRLCEHFVSKASKRHNCSIRRIRKDALDLLLQHSWPGNVRELENCLESAVIFSDDEISPSTLSLPRRGATQEYAAFQMKRPVSPDPVRHGGGFDLGLEHPFEGEPTLRELEAKYIRYLLEKNGGNRSACSKILDVGRNTLIRKIKEYHLFDKS